jgi:uncharacterized spore protein YtfJ
MRQNFCKVPYGRFMHIVYTGALTLENLCVITKPLRLCRVRRSTILMLKLFENRVINTMNKLAVSIEDIKGGRFGGEDKGRDGGGGGGGGGAGMTHDVMSVLTEQHNRLMLALAAQTQELEAHTQQLDKLEHVLEQARACLPIESVLLEHVCLHRTRSDEHREYFPWRTSPLRRTSKVRVRAED